jgi:hypothetical protein
MHTITVWLLIAMGASFNSSPVVVGRYADKAACEDVRNYMVKGIGYIYERSSICVRSVELL